MILELVLLVIGVCALILIVDPCNLSQLIDGGKPFRALSHHELDALMVMLKANALHAQSAGISNDLNDLLDASACFTCIPSAQKKQIRAFLSCVETVAAGASENCSSAQDLIEEAKLWAHVSHDELAAIQLYLDCQEVASGDIALP